jgi:hypothetical protein
VETAWDGLHPTWTPAYWEQVVEAQELRAEIIAATPIWPANPS